jgi:hypothetical protein
LKGRRVLDGRYLRAGSTTKPVLALHDKKG